MSDQKDNKRESGMSAKEPEGNDKNNESSTSLKEAVQEYNDSKEYEGRREERRRSMEHAFKDTMDAFS